MGAGRRVGMGVREGITVGVALVGTGIEVKVGDGVAVAVAVGREVLVGVAVAGIIKITVGGVKVAVGRTTTSDGTIKYTWITKIPAKIRTDPAVRPSSSRPLDEIIGAGGVHVLAAALILDTLKE